MGLMSLSQVAWNISILLESLGTVNMRLVQTVQTGCVRPGLYIGLSTKRHISDTAAKFHFAR